VNALWFAFGDKPYTCTPRDALATGISIVHSAAIPLILAPAYVRSSQKGPTIFAYRLWSNFFLLFSMYPFSFSLGLVIFLFYINRSIASGTLTLVALCGLSYIIFTVIPIFFRDSPFQTPLSTAAWYYHHLPLRTYSLVAKHVLVGFGKMAGFDTWRTQEYIFFRSQQTILERSMV